MKLYRNGTDGVFIKASPEEIALIIALIERELNKPEVILPAPVELAEPKKKTNLPKIVPVNRDKIDYKTLIRKSGEPEIVALSSVMWRKEGKYFYSNACLMHTNCETVEEIQSLEPSPLIKYVDMETAAKELLRFAPSAIKIKNKAFSENSITFPDDRDFWKALKVFQKSPDTVLTVYPDRIEVKEGDENGPETSICSKNAYCKMTYSEPMDIKIAEIARFSLDYIRTLKPQKLIKCGNTWINPERTICIQARQATEQIAE